MTFDRALTAHHEKGVTMVEVLVAALLIFMSLGGIFAMNARSIHILRATRQVTASSLMAQQRLETIRSSPWPEFTNPTALTKMLKTPTESEKELSDAQPIETISIMSANPDPALRAAAPICRVQRQGKTIRTLNGGDLGGESMILVSAKIQWRALYGTQERTRQTVIYRSGLTRSGIFGGGLGRPGAVAATSAPTFGFSYP